jgi:hypothetical protein
VGSGDLGWRYGEEVGQWTAVMAWRLGFGLDWNVVGRENGNRGTPVFSVGMFLPRSNAF